MQVDVLRCCDDSASGCAALLYNSGTYLKLSSRKMLVLAQHLQKHTSKKHDHMPSHDNLPYTENKWVIGRFPHDTSEPRLVGWGAGRALILLNLYLSIH